MKKTKMKEWPDKGTVNVDDLLDPLKEILIEAIKKGDEVYKTGIKYHGYNIGRTIQATEPSPDKALDADHLLYGLKEQNRDVLDTILVVAFQLGFEQGRRHLAERMDMVNLFIENLSSQTTQLSDALKIILK